jgi:hypothetical protein
MGEQHLMEVESPSWIWIFRLILLTSFMMTLASNLSYPSTSSDGTLRWKTQFYYTPTLNQGAALGGADSSTTHQYETEFLELNKALRKYREASQAIIRQLSLSHEVALRTEQIMLSKQQNGPANVLQDSELLSRQIEGKISKVAELLEKNAFVLESHLKPFPVTIGASRFTNLEPDLTNTEDATTAYEHGPNELLQVTDELPPLARYIPPYKPHHQGSTNDSGEELPYQDAAQIVAHITRDWTSDAAPIRKKTYDWIVDQLWKYHRQQASTYSATTGSLQCSIFSPVLVPGAGCGRLAYDLAFAYEELNTQKERSGNSTKQYHFPFEVEAADSSIVMASAAHHILNSGTPVQHEMYPFVNDPFINEVDTEKRWNSLLFPEDKVLKSLNRLSTQQSDELHGTFVNEPALSYTIGDFVTTYASKAKHQMYGTIATCYFIDTATNIYEYILTIQNLLRPNGLWINVGPVQWHRNAQLQPSLNELRQLIEQLGFEIHHWQVEDELVGYRHPSDVSGSRFTRSQGYRPLKFVATYQGISGADDLNLVYLFEKVRLSTGRKSMLHPIDDKRN